MNIKKVIRQLLPPIISNQVKHLFSEWEYVPEGWSKKDRRIKGWNDQSIMDAQEAHWPTLVNNVEGTGPLGVSHLLNYTTRENLGTHNTVMSYAYVLSLSARKKDDLTILDWGGGVGHYYLYSKALLPDIKIKYYCFDVPMLCKLGRRLLPEVNFYENQEDLFQRQYDLVVISDSLHYFENWSEIIHKLAKITKSYFYIAKLHIVDHAPSFVVVQKPYRYGYNTEYLSWFFNRRELLKCIKESGMELIREFLYYGDFYVKKAPEQGETRGFLFHPRND